MARDADGRSCPGKPRLAGPGPRSDGEIVHCLAFGTYDTSVHPRFGVLLDGLRSLGTDVIEVNLPLGLDTATRVQMLRQPWRLPRLALRLLGRWSRLAVRGRRMRRRMSPRAVLVGYLGHFDVVLARALFPRTRIVLDHLIFAADTARDRQANGRVKNRLLRLLDGLAMYCADVIVVDTPQHAAMVPSDLADRVVICPVGAPQAWLDAGSVTREPDEDTPLRVVFYGLFTPLQGAAVIAQAAQLLADREDIRWTMVGRGQDRAAAREHTRGHRHVEWLDWIPPDELPALVAAHDVCLGIFGTGPKSLRVVPNKVFQGAAAGCAVITADTPPQRAMLGDDAVYVHPGDAEALAAAVARLADDRAESARLGLAARSRALRSFAPTSVAAPLRESLDRMSHS
jgi:glycosyltransferase involved in cell wall biosynthesis